MHDDVYFKIADEFPITDDEFVKLDQKFGKLTKFAAWQLLKNNDAANHTDDFEDINQKLSMALMKAGTYYKRQVYIEKSLAAVKEQVQDSFLRELVLSLDSLWQNRTRHGASRQKFGFYQEQMLEKLLKCLVPPKLRPNKAAPLIIDAKFTRYCKAICWNVKKGLGKEITKGKVLRSGLVSISEHDGLQNIVGKY